MHRWLRDSVQPAVRPSTFSLYEMMVRRHITPRLGGLSLSRLGPQHIQTLLAEMEREGASARLRQVAHGVLRKALGQAVEWRLIPANPAAARGLKPSVPAREMRTLTSEQARRFLAAAEGSRLYALYCVLLGCGLRLGEALGLSWTDLDLDAGTLTVRRQLTEVDGRLALAEPKTRAALRQVHLPAFVGDALRAHEERMRTEGRLLNDRLLIFVDTEGKPLRRSNLRRRSFLPLLQAAGIAGGLRMHDLRHSFATAHLQAGTHPLIVSRQLGHSRVSITLDRYSHAVPSLGREAAERLDALLRRNAASGPAFGGSEASL